jgi:hypothetical protein
MRYEDTNQTDLFGTVPTGSNAEPSQVTQDPPAQTETGGDREAGTEPTAPEAVETSEDILRKDFPELAEQKYGKKKGPKPEEELKKLPNYKTPEERKAIREAKLKEKFGDEYVPAKYRESLTKKLSPVIKTVEGLKEDIAGLHDIWKKMSEEQRNSHEGREIVRRNEEAKWRVIQQENEIFRTSIETFKAEKPSFKDQHDYYSGYLNRIHENVNDTIIEQDPTGTLLAALYDDWDNTPGRLKEFLDLSTKEQILVVKGIWNSMNARDRLGVVKDRIQPKPQEEVKDRLSTTKPTHEEPSKPVLKDSRNVPGQERNVTATQGDSNSLYQKMFGDKAFSR